MNWIKNPWLLAIVSGLLLSIAWPPVFFNGIIFIAFVPLLILEDQYYRGENQGSYFTLQVWLTYFIWNFLTTYWVWFASKSGAVMAIVAHSAIQTLPWVAFHFTRKNFKDKLAYPALVFFLLTLEYVDFNWDIMWPWLTLGNAFAKVPSWVQWYEYTGLAGGAVWIILVNVLAFRALQQGKAMAWVKPAFYVLLPLSISWIIAANYESQIDRTIDVVVIQPNVDPYSEKFDPAKADEQVDKLIRLSESKLDTSVRLLMWPETALTDNFIEEEIGSYTNYRKVKRWLAQYPNLTLVTGASTFHFFKEGDKVTSSARQAPNGQYYDAYNTAIRMRYGYPDVFYHKAKLVPGVERMPFIGYLPFLEQLAINLDGTSGTLGISDEATVMEGEGVKMAPIICYESVFSDYCTEYVRNGANLLGIITNDGWWRNTPGYRQHFDYARLRAIENRRYIARSANTGISGFVDDRGNVLARSEWWVPDAMRMSLPLISKQTWYSQSGDFLGRISIVLGSLVLVAGIFRRKTKKGY
ncbi:MAG: apolipoprotein N-acyltransferase [Bacteroidetes bacterium]|nr:MAG: apolipoprotein N-acyltransferase [Bacteroidota bacterium]